MSADNDRQWRNWLKRHERELKGASHYNEYNFAQRVLSYVDGLSPSMVTYQYPLKDSLGKSRYIDFVVNHHALARPIAIEVDGAKFAGNDYVLRQNAIISEGFHLLRFTNNQVTNEPRAVCKTIEKAIASNQRVAGGTTAGSVRRPNRKAAVISIAALLIAVSAVTTALILPGEAEPGDNHPCPENRPIKGNISRDSGELIYHVPGGQFYLVTNPVECFNSEDQAQTAGYRKSNR